jgi:hypothetical protein
LVFSGFFEVEIAVLVLPVICAARFDWVIQSTANDV